MEEKNNSNSENNSADNNSSDFSKELETEKNNFDAEKFAQKQNEYRQIIQPSEQIDYETNPYIWRIGFGRRLGGYIIDNVFLILVFLISAVITGVADRIMDFFGNDLSVFTNPEKMDEVILFTNKTLTPLMLAVTFIYYSLEVIFAQSLGKILLGMQIGSIDKKFATYPQLLFRLVLKLGSSVFTLLFLISSVGIFETFGSIWSFAIFVGCFFVLNVKKQSLHDIISGTAVYFKDELQQLNSNNGNK